MNNSIYIRVIILSVSLFTLSCFSKISNQSENDISFNTFLKKTKNDLIVGIVLRSNFDTTFVLAGEALIVGCPFYQEEQPFFKKKLPDVNELKFSQLILENKKGNYRVFSSQFTDSEEETIIRMPNCAFVDEKVFDLKAGKEKIFEFDVWSLNDLRVEKSDNKIRIHLYYKDDISGKGAIFSSCDWLSVL